MSTLLNLRGNYNHSMSIKNFINEWKFALFNTVIYSLFVVTLFYLTVPEMLLLAAWGWLCSCLGNSVVMHRYYTHQQFTLSKPVEYALLPFAIIIGIGSPIMYALLHRQHHRVLDTAGDPHSPAKLGIWSVVTGLWEFYPASYFKDLGAKMPKDLLVQPLQRFIHDNYYRLWLGSLAVLSLINWHLFVALFTWAAVYQKLAENIVVNGICHPGKDRVLDWPSLGFVTGGESMQKFHHDYPMADRNHQRWYVDPVYPLLKVLRNDTSS